MKYIGAHVSIAGGVENAPLRARELEAGAFALFTKNQLQWNAPPISAESAAAFRANCAAGGYEPGMILAHDSYLINLAQPDAAKRKAAIDAFKDELERCRVLGLDRLNFHPGSHLGKVDDDAGLRLIAGSVREALDRVPEVTAVFENTAGQGSNLGYSFEQLARMLELTDRPGRVGVCIDTCHATAAGYDLRDEEAYCKTWERFASLIGFEYLRGMHLNDAKNELGSRVDRHASLGEGTLGWRLFERIMTDPRFDGIPLILETPDESKWAAEIARLKELANNPG